MKVVIIGCGKIGRTVLARFVEEGHDVTVVDCNDRVLDEATNVYDAMSVCGNGSDCNVLKEANVQDAELFISVTDSDELNMLCCYLAKKMGAGHTIARIRRPEYNLNSLSFLKQQLDISMVINPELLAAREIYNILKLPSAVKIETFSTGNFEIIELVLKGNSALTGMRLMDIRNKYKAKFLVCVVMRDRQVYIPSGDFVLREGDKIGLTAAPSEIIKLMRQLGLETKKAGNVMILGGSRTAYYLASLLGRDGHRVKLIEKNAETCMELSETLPKAVIINGDGAQREVLLEEGLDTTDAFVSLTGMDEQNILVSIFASTHKVPTIISKVNRSELTEMAGNLGLDCLITPRKIVSNVLVQYARALENSMGSNVETLYELMEGRAEVLEFKVGADFRQANVPIRELRFKENILIAGILRDRTPIIPSGDDVIRPNDKVIVVAANRRMNDLSDIFR